MKTWYRWIHSVSKNSKTTLLVYQFSPLHPAQIAEGTVIFTKEKCYWIQASFFKQHPITDFRITIVAVEMAVIKDRAVIASHVLWCTEYVCTCSKCQVLIRACSFLPWSFGGHLSGSRHSFLLFILEEQGKAYDQNNGKQIRCQVDMLKGVGRDKRPTCRRNVWKLSTSLMLL